MRQVAVLKLTKVGKSVFRPQEILYSNNLCQISKQVLHQYQPHSLVEMKIIRLMKSYIRNATDDGL